MNQKRCLTIQDYSCMGRCSLTVALPIMSAQGIETIGLPTAVLSNHTAFKAWTYDDLTDEMIKSVNMWMDYNHHFDCIYTGYLGTNQIDVVIDIIEKLKEENTIVMIDPAFGDNGKMYPGFDQKEHIAGMRRLLKHANMTCPNLTEAYFLTDHPYSSEKITKKEVEEIINDLAKLGPTTILLTGIVLEDGKIGCAYSQNGKTDYYSTICYPGRYHGAGDSFCSAFVGCMLNDIPLNESVQIAHDFIHESMHLDIENNVDGLLYGLQFEKAIPSLLKNMKKI